MVEDTCNQCGSVQEIVDVEFFPEENNYQPIFGCHCDDGHVISENTIHTIWPNDPQHELPF